MFSKYIILKIVCREVVFIRISLLWDGRNGVYVFGGLIGVICLGIFLYFYCVVGEFFFCVVFFEY